MTHRNAILAICLLVVLFIVGCTTTADTPEPTAPAQEAELANPASQNCIDQGGTLSIEQRGDGGDVGVCYFEDNQQCEEWALMRGECPAGGVKVTGYTTPAARYCAITGGTYAITGTNDSGEEQGTCTLPNGVVCDVWDYYNGVCTSEAGAQPSPPTEEWQTYTDAEVGYSLQMPLTWTQTILPDQNEGAIHGMAFAGTEGAVEVYWGVGFGGACPSGTEPVQLAVGELQACHTTNADGTENWEQIGYEVPGGNSFSTRAYTSNAEPASHDLVLQVLSTLNFMPPEQAHAGETIQPLSMEVCDGLAQAMSHTLDDLVPTQSEEPLEDFVTGTSGTGCQATITGTGLDFESPDAVMNELGSMLEDEGYTQDPMLAAGGPTAIGQGYRSGDQMCQAVAGWQPDESANCPDDQPISACEVTPEQQNYTVTLNCGVEVPAG